ncbi:MAG: LysE family translocator [Flavobacteriales bacterium AspAUS03]
MKSYRLDKKKRITLTQGIMINLFNPKSIVTYMAFLPQFIQIEVSHPTRRFLFLGWILTLIAASWYLLMVYFSDVVGHESKITRLYKKESGTSSGQSSQL